MTDSGLLIHATMSRGKRFPAGAVVIASDLCRFNEKIKSCACAFYSLPDDIIIASNLCRFNEKIKSCACAFYSLPDDVIIASDLCCFNEKI